VVPGTSYLFVHISYPNAADLINARKNGCSPGGDIGIHGLRKGWEWIGRLHRLKNWTKGCLAVTNSEIKEIYFAVNLGTPIEILP
jgi:murein L,D-transpeptidase YafK